MMIKVIDDYFAKGCGRCERFDTPDCSTKTWERGLAELRRICHEAGLDETVKWGHPCYTHAGRNIAIFGALRGDFRLSFFQAALLADPDGVLEKSGPNTQHKDMIRFVRDDDVVDQEATIRAYLAEAMAYAAAGRKAPKTQVELELPVELSDALADDEALATAFDRLTPGRQRSYVIHIGGAKKSETRVARIEKCRDKILAGKGAMER